MNLYDKATGKVMRKGDTVTTFRGVTYTLYGWIAPHKPSSVGRVIVVDAEGNSSEFYPSVINAEIMSVINAEIKQ